MSKNSIQYGDKNHIFPSLMPVTPLFLKTHQT